MGRGTFRERIASTGPPALSIAPHHTRHHIRLGVIPVRNIPKEGGVTDTFREFNGMVIVCVVCYAEAKSRHSLQATNAYILQRGLTIHSSRGREAAWLNSDVSQTRVPRT